MTNTKQPKLLWMQVPEGYPKAFGSIIISFDCYIAIDMYQIVHINGMHSKSTILIDIRTRKQVFHLTDFQSCFFLDFPAHSFLGCFVHVHKPSWQVERTLCRFFSPAYYQQLAAFIKDKGSCGSTGIGEINETTVLTLLALKGVEHKMLTATNRAVSKLF